MVTVAGLRRASATGLSIQPYLCAARRSCGCWTRRRTSCSRWSLHFSPGQLASQFPASTIHPSHLRLRRICPTGGCYADSCVAAADPPVCHELLAQAQAVWVTSVSRAQPVSLCLGKVTVKSRHTSHQRVPSVMGAQRECIGFWPPNPEI